MRRIVISDNVDTITLLRDLVVDVTPEPVEKEVDMASGRTVADVTGYKDVLNLPVGYLSLEDNSKLSMMITRLKSRPNLLRSLYILHPRIVVCCRYSLYLMILLSISNNV